MFELFDRFQAEWPHIKEAPWSFAIAMVISSGVTYLVLSLINRAAFSAKDATIENLRTQIDGLKANAADLEKKLAAFADIDVGKAEAKADQPQMRMVPQKVEAFRPNYEAWKHAETITLLQAAFLWNDLEPKALSGRSSDVNAWLAAFCDAIKQGKLGFVPSNNTSGYGYGPSIQEVDVRM
jgi:hypothetical protein